MVGPFPAQGTGQDPTGHRLIEVTDPSGVIDSGKVFVKDVAGRSELAYVDDIGQVVIMTSNGSPAGAGLTAPPATRVPFGNATGTDLDNDAGITYAKATSRLSLTGDLLSPRVVGSVAAAGSLTLRATDSATPGPVIFETEPGVEVARLTSSGSLLVGETSIATDKAITLADNNFAQFILTVARADLNQRVFLDLQRARGTLASPAATQNNDPLGVWTVRGHSGAGFSPAGRLEVLQDGAIVAGGVPGRIRFETTSSVSGVGVEALRVDSLQRTLLATGSTSQVSLGGLDDTDTGLSWGVAADNLLFLTGGVERARFNATGRLIKHGGTLPSTFATLEATVGSPGLQVLGADGAAGVFHIHAAANTTAMAYSRHQGTLGGGETDVGAGLGICSWQFFAWRGGAMRRGAFISVDTEAVGATTADMRIGFNTSVAGSGSDDLQLVPNNSVARVRVRDGSTTIPSLGGINDTDTGLSWLTGNVLAFLGGGTERARFDPNGAFVISNANANAFNPDIQFEVVKSTGTPVFGTRNYHNPASGNAAFQFRRFRGTISVPVAVQNNDVVGAFDFLGTDTGINATTCARIFAEVDGSPGAAGCPGRIILGTATATSGGAATDALQIDSSQNVAIPNGTLTVGTAPTYTVTSALTDRSFDADTVTLDELADVVATMIADNQTIGLYN